MNVAQTRIGSIALLTFSHPPVNAISARAGLPQAITEALKVADADPEVHGVVIRGEGRCFSAGADIGDFDADNAKQNVAPLRQLMDVLDNMSKPVVAAIHGVVFGGGLEFALACHARVCSPDAKIAFPEVSLGLLPGSGGTQRAPRLAGAGPALDLMLRGTPIDAAKAQAIGLIDLVTDGDLVAEAMALALRLADSGAQLPRARDRAFPAGAEEAIAAARAGVAKGAGSLPARQGIIDCVAAAYRLPFDQGTQTEYDAFDALMLSDESRGLRHAFLGERTVAKIPNLPKDLKAKPIASAAVIGAGTMGAGIAVALLNADLPVTLIEQRPEGLERGVGYVRKTIEGDVAKGRLSADKARARLGRLTTSLDMASAGQADIIIEAVFEDAEVKRQVFTALDAIAKPGAILASNTSTLDLNTIASYTQRPQDVVGAHFFSPANIMKLLEVVRGDQTSPQTLATAMGFAKAIGKIGVVAGVCNGFIGNRLFEEYLRQAYYLLEEGASPQQIDGAIERWGMAMGPLKVMDLVGQDIGWSIRQRRAVEQPDRPYSKIPDRLYEMGRYGHKTGAGYYNYPDGRTAVADPEVEAMIAAEAKASGAPQRTFTDEEIVARCVLALVNEGAKVVGEGIAYRPVDVDIVYLHGYGFPRQRGGPMQYADRLGLKAALEQIKTFQAGYQGWAWEPAPLLVQLAGRGGHFADLDG